MANLLQQALSSLATSLQAAGGVEVVYNWGEYPIKLTAVKGETIFATEASSGLMDEFRSVDWIIRASDLVVGGEEVEPSRGDLIEHDSKVYEVMPVADLRPYRQQDTYGIMLRVHTLLRRLDYEQGF